MILFIFFDYVTLWLGVQHLLLSFVNQDYGFLLLCKDLLNSQYICQYKESVAVFYAKYA